MKKVLIILGREQLEKDSKLYHELFGDLKIENLKIKFDPSDRISSLHEKSFLFFQKYPYLNRYFKKFYLYLHRIIIAFQYRDFRFHYFKLFNPLLTDFEFRKKIIELYIGKLGNKYEKYILGRSQGAIIASQIAEKYSVSKLFCLGYPFKNPEREEEEYRTFHLKDLKTPTIIFQGLKDEYGNPISIKKYPLSNSIKIHFFDTDHGFSLPKEDYVLIQSIIKQEVMKSH